MDGRQSQLVSIWKPVRCDASSVSVGCPSPTSPTTTPHWQLPRDLVSIDQQVHILPQIRSRHSSTAQMRGRKQIQCCAECRGSQIACAFAIESSAQLGTSSGSTCNAKYSEKCGTSTVTKIGPLRPPAHLSVDAKCKLSTTPRDGKNSVFERGPLLPMAYSVDRCKRL